MLSRVTTLACAIAQPDARVDQRNFHQVVQRFFLFLWELGAQVRNRHIPAGQDAGCRAQRKNLFAACVGDLYFARGVRFPNVANPNYGAVEPDASRRAA